MEPSHNDVLLLVVVVEVEKLKAVDELGQVAAKADENHELDRIRPELGSVGEGTSMFAKHVRRRILLTASRRVGTVRS